MKLLVVDDHFLVIDGLKLLLQTFDFVTEVFTAGNAVELRTQVQAHQPDVVFLDVNLGNEDARLLLPPLHQEFPAIKWIALTSYHEKNVIQSCIKAGFNAYLLKTDNRDTIALALQKVMAGEPFLSPKAQGVMFEQAPESPASILSDREKEVLQLIVNEKTNKEIAEALFIAEKTVENHRANLMLKLEVRNMAGLVKKALLLGLVQT